MGATITERYEGVVTSVEDDQNAGRIKCTCPGLTGDESTELPFFLDPVHDWGWFAIPDVDETVEIEVIVSSPQDEIFGQSSLEGINARWRGKRFINENAPTHPDFVADDARKRRGWATPSGHIFIVDDEAQTLRVTWMKSPDAPEAERSSLLFDADGKIHIIHKEKHEILLEDTKLTVTLNDGNALTMEQNEADLTAKFGDGMAHVAIVEHLKAMYEEAKSKYDDHEHDVPDGQAVSGSGTGVGNLGAPVSTTVTITNSTATAVPTSDKFPDWDSKIESTHISVPDES